MFSGRLTEKSFQKMESSIIAAAKAGLGKLSWRF